MLKPLKYICITVLGIIFYSQSAFAISSNIKSQVDQTLKAHSFVSKAEKDVTSILWNKLAKNNNVVLMGKDQELRVEAVNLQAIVEATMLKALREHEINKVVVCIHSPTPATPLRITASDILPGILPKKYEKNAAIVRTLLFRHNTLTDLLKEKAVFFSVYNKTPTTKIIGYSNYSELVDKYKNLYDTPLKEIPSDFWGATYLMQDNWGNITAFSITATQITNAPEGIQKWELWFGSINNSVVSERIVKIDSFLKAQGVDLYKALS